MNKTGRDNLVGLSLILFISATLAVQRTGAQPTEFDIQGRDEAKPQDEEVGEKKGNSGQPNGPASPDFDYLFDLPTGDANITFGEQWRGQRCFSGEFVKMCSVTGPVTVQLRYKEIEKTYDLKAGEYGICYTGRVKVFCDIRAGAGVGE